MLKLRRIILLLLAILCVIGMLPVVGTTALAASNPYPTSQTVGGVVTIPCTYYAWQQTYDRLGIALPAWGNAINWYNAAANAGYSVGTTPQANSIAVWSSSSHSYGHVGFVTAVNGSQMTVNEGGRTDATGNGGIVNGQVVPSTVGTTWYGRTLIGFVYLTTAPTISASWDHYADKHQVGSTNAVLAGRINLNTDISAVSRVGIYLYDYNGNTLASGGENTSLSGYNYMNMWFDVNAELKYTLNGGTPYKYKFFAVVQGKTYYSPVYDFRTSGTHNHTFDSGRVTKSPTCNAVGLKTYTCTICGGTTTKTIAKLTTHTYTNNSDTACNTCGAVAYPGGNTLVKENGKWYHVVNRQKVTDTTLVKYGGYWFYVKDGVVDFNATTLCKWNGKWYYVKNGQVDFKSNTLCKWNGMWFHVKDGVVVYDTTLVKYGGYWFYVKDGIVDFDATTLCYYGGYWFYVKDGQVNYSNTLCKWNGKWWHVKNGTVVYDTTLVKYGGYWFYLKNGVVDFDATTLCYYGGYWFYVKDGQVNYSNTLCKWNGKWWHVKNGTVVKDTTLVYFGSNWYYVKNGVVDFSYSGKVLFSGKYYTVKNGVKV